ncbi:leucine-rich repeat protein [Anaerocolumna xylanovorans]|uniref:Ig-like domain (Group 2) n=1 Tax=Anaerocolumna xylanovorans DSM 12503 TaxID=1121345 RepID=A0A1M7XWM0_9FIRM|nr:leucine-rich repeat protein [Anaerocolumna xylanovorans]SHO43179.1 Ig-like domain (group 2) [Anaerocolumna xylanovorans DSM 12503]
MKRTLKKLGAALLALCIVMTMLPVAAFAGTEDNVTVSTAAELKAALESATPKNITVNSALIQMNLTMVGADHTLNIAQDQIVEVMGSILTIPAGKTLTVRGPGTFRNWLNDGIELEGTLSLKDGLTFNVINNNTGTGMGVNIGVNGKLQSVDCAIAIGNSDASSSGTIGIGSFGTIDIQGGTLRIYNQCFGSTGIFSLSQMTVSDGCEITIENTGDGSVGILSFSNSMLITGSMLTIKNSRQIGQNTGLSLAGIADIESSQVTFENAANGVAIDPSDGALTFKECGITANTSEWGIFSSGGTGSVVYEDTTITVPSGKAMIAQNLSSIGGSGTSKIILAEGAGLQGYPMQDRDTPLTSTDPVTAGAADAAASPTGLSAGTYTWDGTYFTKSVDTTAPTLSAGTVNRTSDTEAAIGFTTGEEGTAFYAVVDSGAAALTKESVAGGTSLGTVSGTVTDKSVTLTAGAKDIYVVVKDAANNISEPLKIEAAAYSAPIGDAGWTLEDGHLAITSDEGMTGWIAAGYTPKASVTTLTIGEAVSGIPVNAFVSCLNLATVTFDGTPAVTSIGGSAFSYCALTAFTIPANVNAINPTAFVGTPITTFTVADGNTVFGVSAQSGALLTDGGATLYTFPKGITGEYTVEDSITAIGGFAFDETDLSIVVIPDTVTSIGDSAFPGDSMLTAVFFESNNPPAIEGNDNFLYCDKLSSIYVPAGAVDTYKEVPGLANCVDMIKAKPDENPSVNNEDGLKAALEYELPQTITMTDDITVSAGNVIVGADHTLNINGNMLTISGSKAIYTNAKALTINGGTVRVANPAQSGIRGDTVGATGATSGGTLNLVNVTVNLENTGSSGGLSNMNITVGSGATINLNSSTAGGQILLGNDRTLTINTGAAVNVNAFSSIGINIQGGTVHINGGTLSVKVGSGINQGIRYSMGGSLLNYSSGTLSAEEGSGIYLIDTSKVKGLGGKFKDRGTVFTDSGQVTVGDGNAAASPNGLTEGTYFWNGTQFEKHGINVTTEPQDATVTQGAISGFLSAEGTASNGNLTIGYQWWQRNEFPGGGFKYSMIDGATGSSFAIPTDLTEGIYIFRCKLTAAGCHDGYTRDVTVTVNAAVPSSNANLASLTVSGGTLSPAFDPGTTGYSVSVANSVSSITAGATAADAGATVTGAGAKALSVGANTITITVTAEDGVTTKTYTVTVTRAANSGDGNNSGGSPSTPTPTPTPDPSTYPVTGNSAESWSGVMQALQGGGSGQLNINMTGTTVLPGAVLKELAGTNQTVTFTLGDGISWSISGNEIKKASEDGSVPDWKNIDLKVTVGAGQIPEKTLEALAAQTGAANKEGIILLSLSHDGSFGFTPRLSVSIGSSQAGRTANLFYYNPATGQLELMCTAAIDSEGNTVFPFSHASDYAIAVDDGTILKAELDKLALTPAKKTLYTGGNTGKSTALKVSPPASLSTLTKEDSLYPVITYTSSDPKVAAVTAEGKVTAKKAGKAVITVTVTAGGVSKALKTDITVKEAYIKLVKAQSSLKQGESFTYTATGYGVSTDKITWTTTKKSIVVIDKKTGKATGKSAGTDTVVAKYGSVQKVIKVMVK